jgi:hypothetical protein
LNLSNRAFSVYQSNYIDVNWLLRKLVATLTPSMTCEQQEDGSSMKYASIDARGTFNHPVCPLDGSEYKDINMEGVAVTVINPSSSSIETLVFGL